MSLFPTNNREVFLALDSDARSTVFEEPLLEVVLLLERNLLVKFKESLKLLRARAVEAAKVGCATSCLLDH